MTEVFGVQDEPTGGEVHKVLGSPNGESLLHEFVEEAQKEIRKEVTFRVERGKTPMFARFLAVVDLEEIKRYKRAAIGQRNPKKATPEDYDPLIANGMVLIEKNIGIFKGGTADEFQVFAPDGEPLTFRSREFLDIYPQRESAVDALKLFLGDAQLTTMGEAVYQAAGYGEDLTPVDPTNG